MKKLSSKKTRHIMHSFHIVFTLVLMFGFGCIPPFKTITSVGMKVMGVFLGIIYGYSTCEIVWPSLFAFVAFGTCGYASSFNDAIASMLGNSTVFQIITQYFAVGAIMIYGFGKWFVHWSLSQKIFQGKPVLYTWCFMFVFMWSAIIVSQIPMALLLYSVWNSIADSCGYGKDSMFRYYGFGGILISLMMGSAMIPYKSWALGLANTWKQITGQGINLGSMFLLTAIAGTIIITLYVFLGAKIFHIDFSYMKAFDVDNLGEDSKHLRPRTKRILAVFLFATLLTIYGGTFPKAPGAAFLNDRLTAGGMFCLCTAILLILPGGEHDGKPCIIFDDIKNTNEAVSWPVIFMCAVTMPIAAALTSEATGILPWLTDLVSPVFKGRSPLFIIACLIIIIMILSNIGSNIAFGSAMIPVISPFVVASGANLMIAGAALIWCANMGLILPGTSAPASVFHGRSEIPNRRMRYKIVLFSAALISVLSILIFSVAQLILAA